MKHNFDVQGEAKKADKIYGELINLMPMMGKFMLNLLIFSKF